MTRRIKSEESMSAATSSFTSALDDVGISEAAREGCAAAGCPGANQGATAGGPILSQRREKISIETEHAVLLDDDVDGALPLSSAERRTSTTDSEGSRRHSPASMSYNMFGSGQRCK